MSCKRPYVTWLYFYVSVRSQLFVFCLEHTSSAICLNISSLLTWRMDLDQASDPAHINETQREKVSRNFQVENLLEIDLRCHCWIWESRFPSVRQRETEAGEWEGGLLKPLQGACLKVCFISRLAFLSANKIPVAYASLSWSFCSRQAKAFLLIYLKRELKIKVWSGLWAEAEHEFGKEGICSFGKHLLSYPMCQVHMLMLKEQKEQHYTVGPVMSPASDNHQLRSWLSTAHKTKGSRSTLKDEKWRRCGMRETGRGREEKQSGGNRRERNVLWSNLTQHSKKHLRQDRISRLYQNNQKRQNIGHIGHCLKDEYLKAFPKQF